MRTWVFSFVSLSCLLGALSTGATGQATPGPVPQKATDQKSFKEVKFKLEWITKTLGQNPSSESETITVCAAEGQTVMTANPIQSNGTYRRVTLRPDLQPDGSYLVTIEAIEFAKDQDRDTPRIATTIRVKSSETKVVQDRVSKGSNYEFEYLFTVTPSSE